MKIEIDNNVYEEFANLVMELNRSSSEVLRELLAMRKVKSNNQIEIHKKPVKEALLELIETPEFKSGNGIEKYLRILNWLCKNHPQDFEQLEQFRFGKRVHFSRNPTKIIQSGKSMTARKIPDSTFYVFPGIENKTKRKIIAKVLASVFKYPHDVCAKVAQSIEDSGITRTHSLTTDLGY